MFCQPVPIAIGMSKAVPITIGMSKAVEAMYNKTFILIL